MLWINQFFDLTIFRLMVHFDIMLTGKISLKMARLQLIGVFGLSVFELTVPDLYCIRGSEVNIKSRL